MFCIIVAVLVLVWGKGVFERKEEAYLGLDDNFTVVYFLQKLSLVLKMSSQAESPHDITGFLLNVSSSL